MTFGAASSSCLLLVQPVSHQWYDPQGRPLTEVPDARQAVRVVADVIEETHVAFWVKPLMGADRKGFIAVQLQSKLPDVPMVALWQPASSQPLLPKPFSLNAVGVSSQALLTLLDAEAEAHRPVEGVWPLSYLMAWWASRQKALPTSGSILLCLSMAHGMRMVLLTDGEPEFSRLLLDTDPAQQAVELDLTLKYLADTRVLERDERPGLVLMQPGPGLAERLQAQGHTIRLNLAASSRDSVLHEVLSLAGPKAPGQLANGHQRRYFLARQATQALQLTLGAVVVAGLLAIAQQASAIITRLNDTQQAVQLATGMEREADRIQQAIAASGVDTGLMRLAIEVKDRELQTSFMPGQVLWPLAQLMQTQPRTELRRTALTMLPTPCGGAQGVRNGTLAGPAPAPALAGTPETNRLEWTFAIRVDEALSPRARQALLDDLSRSVRQWGGWQVLIDPAEVESGAVIARGQNSGGQGTDWQWCLSPAKAEAEATPPPGAAS